jgi:hypothetical protein
MMDSWLFVLLLIARSSAFRTRFGEMVLPAPLRSFLVPLFSSPHSARFPDVDIVRSLARDLLFQTLGVVQSNQGNEKFPKAMDPCRGIKGFFPALDHPTPTPTLGSLPFPWPLPVSSFVLDVPPAHPFRCEM